MLETAIYANILLPSFLQGVSDEAWTEFVRNMATGSPLTVSDSNALGMFEIMPRRLADLGLVFRLSRSKSSKGRTIWVGSFIPPLKCSNFLKNPSIQYKVFCKSIKDYDDKINNGIIKKDTGMSRSGALAILHRAGPRGLDAWNEGKRFSFTEEIYNRVARLF